MIQFKDTKQEADYTAVSRTMELLSAMNDGDIKMLFGNEIREALQLIKVLRDAIIMKKEEANA